MPVPGRWMLVALFGAAVAELVVLERDLHTLRASYTQMRERLAWPHAGYSLPTFSARVLGGAGAALTIGEAPPGGRQVVALFTTTCPYCRATFPWWNRLADSAATGGHPSVQVVGIALDSLPAARAFADSAGLHFPVTTFPALKLRLLYRARSVPLTLVLDETGKVLYSRAGVLDGVAADSVLAAVRAPVAQATAGAAPNR